MNAADRRQLTPALGAAAAVLVIILVALWLGLGRGAHWHDAAAPPKLPPPGSTLPPPAVPALERYAEVWQRPLFSPTRTPEPAAGGGGAASSELELTGVILLPGLKLAILHDKTQNKDYRAILGQPAREGPALIELHPRSAVVLASGTRLTLRLLPGAAPAADAAPAEAGSAPAAGAGPEGSAIVSRRGNGAAVQPATSAGQAAAAARARQLKARIQAARRRVERQNGGGN
ncbi:MAG: general secretion pathway protein GspN [Rhodanobacteraceae bacterium]|nr:MAG: general secretion pathway protein GspN [Rhodanobacteraceae bacterium]